MKNHFAVDLLIGNIFRLYGAIVAAGDSISAPYGLSSARWQVMGAINITGSATVADLARCIGVTRQSVQRIVNEMVVEGYFTLLENPNHRRAKLIGMTEKGWQAFSAVSQAWEAGAEQMDQRFGNEQLRQIAEQLPLLEKGFQSFICHDPAFIQQENK